jgi:mRNA-degrading endonuclease RelE of RelBE toxin-antitoxin system
MSRYRYLTSPEFEEDYKKNRKNFKLIKRFKNKLIEITKNPHHYKPLRNVLKNHRRTHIGSFVLIFEVNENEKLITLHSLKHHDKSYNQ